MVDSDTVHFSMIWVVVSGGQGEIILKLDPIDFEIADFRFKFAKWVRKNIICEHESVHHNSAEEVFP